MNRAQKISLRSPLFPRKRGDRGFTLVELMITVVILAIIAAIGYPLYTKYVRQTRRTAAITALQRAAAAEEKYYAVHNVYPPSLTALNYSSNTVSIPASDKDWYTLSATVDAQGNYVLTATPVGTQIKDDCGTYTLNATGTRTVSGSETLSKCWGSG